MRIYFEATMAGTHIEGEGIHDECVITGISNAQGEYVTFQRHINPEQSDVHDVYCEYRYQQYAGTNCIRDCRISPSALHITLTSSLNKLPDVTGFDVNLHLDSSSYQSLITGLQHIFHHQKAVLVIEHD